ncbi:MAG: phosphopentomutase [Clostridia bacterium]|nr:phosphopentomutase [Clostridia bacterium]
MRVFLIVLDSFGIGELPDAEKFGDKGSNTLKACFKSGKLSVTNMKKLGLFNIDGVDFENDEENPTGSFCRLGEKSAGKDTTVGHWEIAGLISNSPFPTYPNGFPKEIIQEFEKRTGKKVLCNKPYSGTEVINDYGEEHLKTGDLIVYTSADSVFQIACHEEVVSVEKLYEFCAIARQILVGKHAVGRVIARPFVGDEKQGFVRTANRKDFSVTPPKNTLLDELLSKGKAVLGVGKIYDIFGGKGVGESFKTKSNSDGLNIVNQLIDRDFDGLCFINLVDFDSKYGHRNNVLGYTNALNEFDCWLGEFTDKLGDDDMLIITADHGCDPSTLSTDHSREFVPLLVFGKRIKSGVNLGTRESFSDIAKTIAQIFSVKNSLDGKSFLNEIIK